jgi:hypothetical protein
MPQLLPHHGEGGQPVDKKRGLANGSLGQFLRRTFPAEFAQRPAEDFISLTKNISSHREFGSQFLTHPHGLRALAGEDEGNFSSSHKNLNITLTWCA